MIFCAVASPIPSSAISSSSVAVLRFIGNSTETSSFSLSGLLSEGFFVFAEVVFVLFVVVVVSFFFVVFDVVSFEVTFSDFCVFSVISLSLSESEIISVIFSTEICFIVGTASS